MGGVTVNITEEKNDIMADDYGSMPVDSVYNGSTVEVTVPLGQVSSDNLNHAFPHATLNNEVLEHGKVVGERTSNHFQELIITPVNTDFDDAKLTVHNAVVSETSEINFSNSDQTVIEVTFRGYVDPASTGGLIADQGTSS
jgi:hypothetical protein